MFSVLNRKQKENKVEQERERETRYMCLLNYCVSKSIGVVPCFIVWAVTKRWVRKAEKHQPPNAGEKSAVFNLWPPPTHGSPTTAHFLYLYNHTQSHFLDSQRGIRGRCFTEDCISLLLQVYSVYTGIIPRQENDLIRHSSKTLIFKNITVQFLL